VNPPKTAHKPKFVKSGIGERFRQFRHARHKLGADATGAQPAPFDQRAEVLTTRLPDPAPLDIGLRDQPDGSGAIITLRAAAYNTSPSA
jgi:hypothetical protein